MGGWEVWEKGREIYDIVTKLRRYEALEKRKESFRSASGTTGQQMMIISHHVEFDGMSNRSNFGSLIAMLDIFHQTIYRPEDPAVEPTLIKKTMSSLKTTGDTENETSETSIARIHKSKADYGLKRLLFVRQSKNC